MPWKLLGAPAKAPLTPEEEVERQALNAALIETAFPSPTAAGAKLQAQAANPIGTSLSEVFSFVADHIPGGEQYEDRAKTAGFAIGAVFDALALGPGTRPAPGAASTAAMARGGARRPPSAAGAYNAWGGTRALRFQEQTLVFAAAPDAEAKVLKEAQGLMQAYLKSGDKAHLQRLDEMARSEQRQEQMAEGELHPVQVAHSEQSIRMKAENYWDFGQRMSDYERHLSQLRVERRTHEANRQALEERLEKLKGYFSMMKRWSQAQATLRDYFSVTFSANRNDERITKVQEALLQDPYNTHSALNGSGVKKMEFLIGPPPLNSVGSKSQRWHRPYRHPSGAGLSPDGTVLYVDVSTGNPTLIAERINKFLENIPRP
jgi:hypothetical protein